MRMSRAQRSQQVVQLLHKHGPMSARKAAHLLDVVEDTARSFMRRAYLAGQIKCCQHKRMAVWHMEGQEEAAHQSARAQAAECREQRLLEELARVQGQLLQIQALCRCAVMSPALEETVDEQMPVSVRMLDAYEERRG